MVSNRRKAQAICALDALRKLKALSDETERIRQRRTHKFWVRPFLLQRSDHELDCNLLKDVFFEDGTENYNLCRIDIHKFEYILSQVETKIQKCTTVMRLPVPARARLAITLRFLVTGESYKILECLSRVSRKTISVFVPEVLKAIIDTLGETHLKMPTTEEEWEAIADDFNNLWQFPHTLGAINGKHLRIKIANPSGFGRSGIVVLAVVDAHSRFIYVHFGVNSSTFDKTVFERSSLYEGIQHNTLNFPEDRPLSGQVTKTPFYFISDDLFGLDRHLLIGYNKNEDLTPAQKVFNYRLRRVHMTVDLAFERLASRFRIFHRRIDVNIDTTEKIVRTCCILHNFLSETLQNTSYLEDGLFDTENLPKTIRSLTVKQTKNSENGNWVRENVCKYIVSDNSVSVQWTGLENM